MECPFLLVLILTVSGKLVQSKTFTCAIGDTYLSDCIISDVRPLDNIEVTISSLSSQTTIGLAIRNSTLDDIPSISLNNSVRLDLLHCIGCGLADITEHTFTPLPLINLLVLDISNGSFSELEKNLFSKLASLLYLKAKYGAISEVDDDAFFNLTKLKELDLSHNNITEITAKMFEPLVKIYQIDLSYNHIRVLEKNLFFSNPNLSYLNLQHNDISKIDGRIFNTQSVIWSLRLSYNELTALDTRNVDQIFADHNRIKHLSISSTVKGLHVEHNDIENVTCDENGSKIKFLNITNNSLTELGCIGSLIELTELYLSYNNIGKLNQSSFAALTQLTVLSLKSANIGKLEYDVFSHQRRLKNLDISYNHLENIILEMLLPARDLQILYIDGNNLTDFPYNDLKKTFNYFDTISIGDNDFNCTFLGEAIKEFIRNGIKVVDSSSSGHSVPDSQRIIGIGCQDKIETVTPPCIEKNLQELLEDSAAIKKQILKMNSDILSMKAEILKIELPSLQSSSSNTTKVISDSDLIKNVNVILIALIVGFCVYKGYKLLKNDIPCISRDNKANTFYTNIETGNTESDASPSKKITSLMKAE